MVMSNYLSLGVDAQAALSWARLFRATPALFRLRLLNKLLYIICGAPQFFRHSYADLPRRCELTCDGERIELPAKCEGLMVLNTASYGGGSDLWDAERRAPLCSRARWLQTELEPQSSCDGMLEVVGVSDVLHLALSLGGFSNGIRICQGRAISLRVPAAGVPLQVGHPEAPVA